jgi:hypothetical protein
MSLRNEGKKIQRVSFETDWRGPATAMTNHGFGGSLQIFRALVDSNFPQSKFTFVPLWESHRYSSMNQGSVFIRHSAQAHVLDMA